MVLLDKRITDVSLGAILSLGLCVPLLYDKGYFSPIPYAYVELLEGTIAEDGDYQLKYAYEKNGCVQQDLQGYAEYLGRWTQVPITYYTNEPHKTEGVEDNFMGPEMLQVRFDTNASVYSTLELRTRHLCDGEPVDRVFSTIRTKDL